jgi:hypothetical protein
MSTISLRDQRWLEERVRLLLESYFHDAPRGYPICVKFGSPARYRYGCIYSRGKQCYIQINRLFAHPGVPEHVVDATLAHELAHYVHGYGSGLKKRYPHPHRGGVVEKEMQQRGCLFLEEKASAWRKAHWQNFYTAHSAETLARRAAREKREQTQWAMYLNTPGFRTEASLRERLRALASAFGLEETPFEVEWLPASVRRNGLSYLFSKEGTAVRLHGVLADPNVPEEVIDYELSYWLASSTVGGRWPAIERAMKAAKVWERAEKAIKWRRKVWPHYYKANHPLKSK